MGYTFLGWINIACNCFFLKYYAKKINCIIVKDLSRFGRDYLEVGDYLEHIFPFLGVRMISINDHCMEKNVSAIIKRMERDLYFSVLV